MRLKLLVGEGLQGILEVDVGRHTRDGLGTPVNESPSAANLPFSVPSEGRFEGVISTDVLKHCPEEDLDWIIREIFDYSKLFVFCTAALYPALKHLPNGDNAHITQKSAGWWLDKFETAAKEAGGRAYFLALMPSPADFVYVEG